MLKKSARLTSSELKRIFAGPRTSVRGPHFSVSFEKILISQGKFAVVVAKKLAGNAVKRNAIRRSVYRALDGLPALKHNAIIFVEKSLENKDFSEIKAEIQGLLSKMAS